MKSAGRKPVHGAPVLWACVALLLAGSLAVGDPARQDPAQRDSAGRAVRKDSASKGDERAKANFAAYTPEREAAALTFVRQHHPELAELLIYLKEKQPREYGKAIRDLFRTSERLAQVRERNEQFYERELAAWKLKSRIQLLLARIRMSPRDKKLRDELKEALASQVELEQQRLADERERLTARLERIESQRKKLSADRNEIVQRRFDELLQNFVNKKTPSRPAKKVTADGATASKKP